MTMQDLTDSIVKITNAPMREGESFFQYFSRLNHEGRLDVRALTFGVAAILDYLSEQPWNTHQRLIDTRLEDLGKKEELPKTGGKKKK